MKSVTKKGLICIRINGLEYHLCTLSHIINNDDSFRYIFEPKYNVIDLLKINEFQGIPGINLDLRKKEYVRENMTPTFISERVPNENREDLYKLLKDADLSYLDPLEYLFNTKLQYFGDNLYVVPFEDNKEIDISNQIGKSNLLGTIKIILNNIVKGNNIKLDGLYIDDRNRKETYNILLYLYNKVVFSLRSYQMDGIKTAKENKKYCGRKPLDVDFIKFVELDKKVKNKSISVIDACKTLNISKDKYYRFRKKITE